MAPANLKGNAINQMSGNNTKTSNATGHDMVNKRHQRITAIKNLIIVTLFTLLLSKQCQLSN